MNSEEQIDRAETYDARHIADKNFGTAEEDAEAACSGALPITLKTEAGKRMK